ncbi:uncharacterized protein LOC134833845 [Culicoides brevitarsis]|uniref:uncharacterized protein LOC134833845 n=1 Tax=Culicoides brevitarsis TaxID=469753 RepID=UPI00307B68BD
MNSVGSATIGCFLPESIFPKYELPIPFLLPFKNQKTWSAFWITVICQTGVCFVFGLFNLFFLDVLCCLFWHIMVMLDIVRDIVMKLNIELKAKNLFGENRELGSRVLDSNTLGDILAESHDESMKFKDWLEIITDLLVDINKTIISLRDLLSEFFLALEFGVFSILLLSGLILVVIKQQQVFAIGVSTGAMLLYLFCFINERILDKFEEVKNELYNIPWYELSPKDRKILLIAMNCDKIQAGFTAMGIHFMDLKRFASIMNLVYSNVLVLKDIIQK